MSSQTPLKIIGKEFLLDTSNFILPFNANVSTNLNIFLSNGKLEENFLSKLSKYNTTSGKLYFFDKVNYLEPTTEEFKNYSNLSEFLGISPELKPVNYFDVNILFTQTSNNKRIIEITSLNTSGIIPNLMDTPISNFDNSFCILVIDQLGTKKAYPDIGNGDITKAELLYLISSSDVLILQSTTDNQDILNNPLNVDKVKILVQNAGLNENLVNNDIKFINYNSRPNVINLDEASTPSSNFEGNIFISGKSNEQNQLSLNRNSSSEPTDFTWIEGPQFSETFGWGNVIITKDKVYAIGGSRSTTNTTSLVSNKVNSAPIDANGVIGSWTQEGTLSINTKVNTFGSYSVTGGYVNINTPGANVWAMEFTFTTGSNDYYDYNRKAFGPYASRGTYTNGLRIGANLEGNMIMWDAGGAGAGGYLFTGGYKNRTAKIRLENTINGGSRLYMDGVLLYTSATPYNFNQAYGYGCTDSNRYAPGVAIRNLTYYYTTETTISPNMHVSNLIQIKDYIYLIGGHNGLGAVSYIVRSKIGIDGTLGTWEYVTNIPDPLYHAKIAIIDSKLFLFGGHNSYTARNNIYFTNINQDGTLGTFEEYNISLPLALYSHQLINTGKYIYILGGVNSAGTSQNIIYKSTIDKNGILSSFVSAGTLPEVSSSFEIFTTEKTVFLISVGSAKTYKAPINTDGTLGTFVAITNFGISRHASNHICVTKSRIYVIGGRENISGTWKDSNRVFYAELPTGYVCKNDYASEFLQTGTVKNYLNWEEHSNFPTQIGWGPTFQTKNKIYVIGGYKEYTSLYASKYIYSANLNNDILSSWQRENDFPISIIGPAFCQTQNYAYILGGLDYPDGITPQYLDKIYRAQINEDGTMSDWSLIGTLPNTLYTKTVIIGNYIYIIGGQGIGNSQTAYTSNIYKALINEDGSLGTWVLHGTLPVALAAFSIIQTSKKLYILGGYNTVRNNNIYSADIKDIIETYSEDTFIGNSQLTLGTFTQDSIVTTCPNNPENSSVFIFNDRAYIIGSYDIDRSNATSIIMIAEINDGIISKINYSQSFIKPLYTGSQTVFRSNNYIWIFGGRGNVYKGYNGYLENTVYRAKLSNGKEEFLDDTGDYRINLEKPLNSNNIKELSFEFGIQENLTLEDVEDALLEAYSKGKNGKILLNDNILTGPTLLDLVNSNISIVNSSDVNYPITVKFSNIKINPNEIDFGSNIFTLIIPKYFKTNTGTIKVFNPKCSWSYSIGSDYTKLENKNLYPDTISTLKYSNLFENIPNLENIDCRLIWNLNDNYTGSVVSEYNISTTTGVTFVPGKFKTAAYFNGSAAISRTSTDLLLSTIYPQWSISLWIKPEAVQTVGVGLFSYKTVGTASWFQAIFPTTDGGTLKFEANSGTSITVSEISTTEWSHLVLTADSSGNAEVFVNGISKGTGTGFKATVANSFNIGRLNGGSSGYKGSIEQLRIFNGKLTSSHINHSNLVTETKPKTYEILSVDYTSKLEMTLPERIGQGGIILKTHSKVYLYLGRASTSASNLVSQDVDKVYVADIDQVTGEVGNFTYLGTDPLDLYSPTYMVYQDPITKVGAAVVMGGLTASSTYSNIIKIAQIDETGTIGAWTTSSAVMPTTGTFNKAIQDPEDPSIFYITGSHNGSYINKIYTYKIINSGISYFAHLIGSNIYTGNTSAPGVIITDSDGIKWMYRFGYAADIVATNKWENKIVRFKMVNNIAENTYEIVGTFGNLPNLLVNGILFDDLNIYLFGGNGAGGSNIGASNQIVKIDKNELLHATVQNPQNFKALDIVCPYYINGVSFETKYGWYLLPYLTTTTYGTSYSWDSNIKKLLVYPKVEPNGQILMLEDFNLDTTKTKLSKLPQRLLIENTKNLLTKASTTLSNLGEAIKFKDPTTGNIITLSECTKPVALTKLEEIFLEWLWVLTKDTSLTEYNRYLYNNAYGLNTSRNYDIIIPEIIFDILCDRNMLNINKIILGEYLTSYPLTSGLYAKFQSYGYQDSDFNLDDILFSFYRFKINTDIRTPILYDVNGPILPTFKDIDFGIKPRNFDYIFIPQKHNSKSILASNLPPRPDGSSYFDNIGACNYKKKLAENLMNYKESDVEINAYFDYFISPTGSDTNDGLTPYTPKAMVGACPAGKKILLLPGTYTGILNNGGYRHPEVLHAMSSHEVWGCGNKTIIDVPSNISGVGVNGSVVPTATLNGSGSLNNLKVIWRNNYAPNSTITTEYCYAIINSSNVNNADGFTFYRINFANQDGSRYTLASRTATNYLATIYFKNCTITGGIFYTGYHGNNSSTQSITDKYIYDLMSKGYDPTYKGFIDNILDSVEFTPCYTLLPISDDSNPDSNSIILENTANITNIPNFSIKLA